MREIDGDGEREGEEGRREEKESDITHSGIGEGGPSACEERETKASLRNEDGGNEREGEERGMGREGDGCVLAWRQSVTLPPTHWILLRNLSILVLSLLSKNLI